MFAVTDEMINRINSDSPGWVAGHNARFVNSTIADAKVIDQNSFTYPKSSGVDALDTVMDRYGRCRSERALLLNWHCRL